MTEIEIKKSIQEYIANETKSDINQIKDGTLIFEQGIFDSIGLLLLIDFINERFHVKTNDDELLMENFESINSMSNFITRKINK